MLMTCTIFTRVKKYKSKCNRINFKALLIEQRHKISNNVAYSTNKGSDQPAHMHSLIRAFASRLSILWPLSY